MVKVRSYGQYCAVAKALDVVGDRWTLLIVRELLLRGPSRYTELLAGLPGIATNLLSERLRDLEAAGLVERQPPRPPVATPVLRLTARGRQLRPALAAIGAWGAPYVDRHAPGDHVRLHWLTLPLAEHLRRRGHVHDPVRVRLRSRDQDVLLAVERNRVRVDAPGGEWSAEAQPHVTLEGRPDLILAALLGHVSPAAARRQGLRIRGDEAALRRIAHHAGRRVTPGTRRVGRRR